VNLGISSKNILPLFHNLYKVFGQNVFDQKIRRSFLQRPARRIQNPRRLKKEPRQSKTIFAGEKRICLASSAFRPATLPEYLYGQNPKKKNVLSIFRKNPPPRKSKEQGTFFFVGCRVKRGGGGAFVERTIQFRGTTRSARTTSSVLKISASLVQYRHSRINKNPYKGGFCLLRQARMRNG